MQIVALDKTGTITSGEPKVTDMIPAPGISESELLEMACALEKKSEHPLSRAVLQSARQQGIGQELEVEDFQAVPGNGLSGSFRGAYLAGGNLKFISRQAEISGEMRSQAEALAEDGKTPLFFARDGKLIGIIAVADVIKEDSPQAVKELQDMGIRVVMLTGDNERTARAIGRQAGVDQVIAGVLPEGKESVIRQLKKTGKSGHGGRRHQRRAGPYKSRYRHCHRRGDGYCHRRGGCGADEEPSERCAGGYPAQPCHSAEYP